MTVARVLDRGDLFRLKVVGDVSIGVSGSNVAYVVKQMIKDIDDYVSNIHVSSGGQSRQYTWSGRDTSPRISSDERKLAFLSKRSGSNQLYVMPLDGGEPMQLTHLELGAGTPVWAPDSHRICFAAGTLCQAVASIADEGSAVKDREPTKIIDRALYKSDGEGFNHNRRSHIFVVDVESAGVHQLTHGDAYDDSPAWSPDGRHIAFSSNRDSHWDIKRQSDIWMITADGGDPVRITQNQGVWHSPSFSPDGRHLAYVGYPVEDDEEPDDFPQLWSCDRRGGAVRNLLPDRDLSVGHTLGSDWSAGGSVRPIWIEPGLYFLACRHGTANLYSASETGVSPVTSGDHDVMCFSVASDGDVAYGKSDFRRPGEVYRLVSGIEKQVSHENSAEIAAVSLKEPQRIAVQGADGHEVEGWALRPNEYTPGKRYPLLLYIHGGPATAYGHSFFFELQWWACRGYGVAFCNPHGSTSYGRCFQQSIKHDWGNRDYQDVMAFVDEIVDLPWVDKNRLAAAGGSYGGFMVNWLAGHTDRFAAFCTQRSICNMVSQGGTSDFAPFRRFTIGGTPEESAAHLWNLSPLKYVSSVRTPMLILHQEQDHRCPIEQGEQWFSALKRLGVPVRFIRFPDESHGMSRLGKPSRRYERLGYMLEWFDRYV